MACLQITRVNPRVASASLQCVNGQPLSDAFTGVIRQQDVRTTEIDKARASACMHMVKPPPWESPPPLRHCICGAEGCQHLAWL